MSKRLVESTIDQGMHRFLADGVHYRDLMDIRSATPDWSRWCQEWSRVAADAEARGEKALADGLRETAAREFARAALYFHYGQYLLYDDMRTKRATHDRKVAAFHRAAPLFDMPLERVNIPFDGISMAGYFRLPRNPDKPPCVILLGGLDTTKEDYLTVNDLCVQRGLATLSFDGPGQGETQFQSLWRRDFERAVTAVVDFLQTRAEIHHDRIGIIGRSMGGYYAPMAAAVDSRVHAIVSWGAMYHLRNLESVPQHIRDGFIYVADAKNAKDALEFFECINLEGHAAKIRCPMLVVHGGLDNITPMENATRLVAETQGKVETLIWEDSIHCCHDRSHIVRPAMADFMLKNL